MRAVDCDVLVVGYGPVGMATAAMLGRLGHKVIVVERYAGKYNLPRAAIFDDETMRTLALLGVGERLLPSLHVQRDYQWYNGEGQLLIEHEFAERGISGWAEWYMMYQPDLEDALDETCRALPQVEVRFGTEAQGLLVNTGNADAVTVVLDDGSQLRARWVVGCDGGNSFVRQALEIGQADYGFSEPWLVCDFRFRREGVDVPTARQVCDPRRPMSIISLGPRHHRISSMLDSAADFELERDPRRVWERVAAYLTPDDAELIRTATYTFRSLVAHRWRDGRVLLAGDAAHQMPPFLGQGMCSGIRDAVNIAWKLDLVLTGAADAPLLDTYQTEREPHVRSVIEKGIELGRVQTMRDPVAAHERDERLLARRRASAAAEKMVFPPLGPGCFGTGAGVGELFPQGLVEVDGERGRFDELLGYGWVVLDNTSTAWVNGLRVPFGDSDGTYSAWLREHGADAVAVRPDFRVWGTASCPGAAATLGQQIVSLIRIVDRPQPVSTQPE